MRVCLVSPPTVTDFEDPEIAESEAIRLIAEHAPIGILSLAAVLEQRGYEIEIVDLNRRYYDYLRSDAPGETDFCTYATRSLETASFDCIGFSTICSSYPLTLRMAQKVKRSRPGAPVILGGPQASVVDDATLQAFPHVDFIVRGEAEETFPALLDTLASGTDCGSIPGITYRERGRIIRRPNAPVIRDLDALPLPALHLYPSLRECQYVPLELGRGCPFACTFCSTNDFFRRNFRLKSPARMIEQMKRVKATYGIGTFDLIHDMFTVDRKKVVAFCETLLAEEETFYWNCSARTDCIDEELIALMAEAGCRGIFFGIETGSPRMQKVIQKGLDLGEAERMIASADAHGITTAVSLIYGFPDESMDDVRQTVHFVIDSLRYDYAVPQLHLLAPLAGTPIESAHREELTFDEIQSDMSHQGWRQDPADRRIIAEHRHVFPNFYAVPTPHLKREYLQELREVVLKGMRWFRWLLVALDHDVGDFVSVFDCWRAWRTEHRPDVPSTPVELAQYYSRADFRRDFLEFVRTDLRAHIKAHRVVSALSNYEEIVGHILDRSEEPPPPFPSAADEPIARNLDAVATLAYGVELIEMPIDYKKVVRCLKRKGNLSRIRRQAVTVATRPAEVRSSTRQADIVQLSDLSARLLRLCDGTRTIGSIVDQFSTEAEPVQGVSADQACLFGLELLRVQKLVVPMTPPSASA